MAVNLTNADNALKSVYLDVISDRLNNYVNPFYAAIENSAVDVVGKDVKKLVIDGLNGGIGAGEEDGDLPKAAGNRYFQLTAPLKNLYGVIEISDKAVRASENSAGAFVNLLNAEMEGLIKASSFNFSRMLFGDGTGLLSYAPLVVGNEIVVEDPENFAPGMKVDFIDGMGEPISGFQGVTVATVDHKKRNITLVEYPVIEEGLITDGYIYVSGIRNGELTGLKAIFDTTKPSLYGVERTGNAFMTPYIDEDRADISEVKIQKAIDSIEQKCGNAPNMIICSYGVRRALQEVLSNSRGAAPVMEIAGGYKAISYNGIPIVADRFCPMGTMYLLNTDDFVLHQLCDWEWLAGEDDKILRQVPGKPVYTATLVKYAELICNQPKGQGVIRNINEK
jgi:hypothetical protein